MREPFLPVPNRVAFTIPSAIPLIGGLDIMWYGICLTAGILAAFLVVYFLAPSRKINRDKLTDLFLWTVPCGIIGARLYYVIFEWSRYQNNLSEIFNLRSGGLAIHGAIIGGFGAGIICLIVWKESLLDWLDLACIGLPLAQAIGRWGNYFNSEAHGVETDLPWAIYCDGKFVHPTFLYESIWCFLLFLFLLWLNKRYKFKGQIMCLYAILYSIERFFVEGLRTDSLWIGNIRQAQLISVIMIVAGIVGYIVLSRQNKKNQTTLEETQEQNVENDAL